MDSPEPAGLYEVNEDDKTAQVVTGVRLGVRLCFNIHQEIRSKQFSLFQYTSGNPVKADFVEKKIQAVSFVKNPCSDHIMVFSL